MCKNIRQIECSKYYVTCIVNHWKLHEYYTATKAMAGEQKKSPMTSNGAERQPASKREP